MEEGEEELRERHHATTTNTRVRTRKSAVRNCGTFTSGTRTALILLRCLLLTTPNTTDEITTEPHRQRIALHPGTLYEYKRATEVVLVVQY